MTRDEIINNLVRNWVRKADNDLITAERELSFDDPVTETICFHCQQVAEKYLKAFLTYHQIYFTKTHNIMNLLELSAAVEPSFKKELVDADNLTDYAVEIRYPDFFLEPSVEEARDSLKVAKKIKGFVLEKMRLNE